MDIFAKISDIIKERASSPQEGSYTNYLLEKGLDKILKKLGEESAETIIAAKNDSKEEFIYEVADLLYHLLVLLEVKQVSFDEVKEELEGRYRK